VERKTVGDEGDAADEEEDCDENVCDDNPSGQSLG
jgi:hypothetical protein